jgi:hypothetical protein
MPTSKKTPATATPPRLTDPTTGLPAPTADVRAEFERLSRQTPRDSEADRAFVDSKIALIRTDPRLSEDEKKQAIEDLGKRLEEPFHPD